ncbi:hypothetical protein DLJ53_21225 [Acuticoccus sediminis]|uniref:Uncharacterized protein n=1 Tax=Acuticoccus sediminis TaxID=2184697 RepID=A0A8B2NVA7_9HYPH|nr:hypothetical protein [Acuticoccus sediminis]RAI00230.1 hypothetical protein DLJ53_21225 [Acuticoccus sediminis]
MRLRTIATATFAVTLSSAGAYAQDASGSFDAKSAIETFFDNAASIGATTSTYGSIDTEGDTVTVSDVALTWTWNFTTDQGAGNAVNLSVKVPSLQLTSLGFDGTLYSADRIALPETDVSLTLDSEDEDFSYQFVMKDYVTESPSWAAVPALQENAAAPISRFAPIIDAVLKQNHAGASIGGMTGSFTAGQEKQTFEYGAATYGKLENGYLESFSMDGATTTQTMAPETSDPTLAGMPTSMTITYGPMKGEAIDMKPLVALLTGTGATEGPQPVVGSMSFGDMQLEAGDMASFTMGETKINDVTIDPSRGPILPEVDSIYNAVQSGEEPEFPTLMGLILDVYGAMGLGSYTVDGMDVSFPQGSATLGNFSLANLSSSGLGLVSLSGMKFEAPNAQGELGKVEVADVVFPERDNFITAIMASMAAMEPDPQIVMKAIPYLGRFTIGGLDIDSDDVGKIALGVFEARAANFIDAIPTQISLALEGLSIPAMLIQNPMAQGVLTAVGADPVQADGSLTLGWDENSQQVALDEDFRIASIGRLQLSAQLSGIPRFVFAEPQRIQEALVTAAIDGVTATFADEGITGFGINMMSQQSGMPPEQFPSIVAQQAEMQISAMTGNADLANSVSSALTTYLSDPQSISIAAAPNNPVPLAQVMGAVMTAPQALPGLLGFSIMANGTSQ